MARALLRAIALASLGLLAVLVCRVVPMQRVYDGLSRFRAPTPWSEEIVVVRIDEKAQDLFGTWRWPRSETAALLERVAAAEPRTLATTLFFGRAGEPGDARLARALEGVVSPFLLEDGKVHLPAPVQERWPEAAHMKLGVGTLRVSADRVHRAYYPFFELPDGTLAPSLALAALAEHRGWDLRDIRIRRHWLILPDGTRVPLVAGRMLVDFSRPADARIVSAADLDSVDLRDKLVIVQPQVTGRGPHGAFDSNLMHAYAIRTLIAGSAQRHASPLVAMAILVTCMLGLQLVTRRWSLRATAALHVAVAVSVVCAAVAMVAALDLFIPVVPLTVMVLLAGAWVCVPKVATAPLAGDADDAPTGEVAIIFTDVQGSTELWEQHPEAMRTALALHDSILRAEIARHGLYEVKTEGDAFMVTARTGADALRWCLRVQERLNEAAWPEPLCQGPPELRGLRVRMGVHWGAPECRRTNTGRMDYFGSDVNRAARVSDLAAGGQILLSQSAWQTVAGRAVTRAAVVRELGEITLRGLAEPDSLVEALPASLATRTFDGLDTFDGPATRTRRPADVRVGSVLSNRYELDDVLGEGGMATVYRAWDRELEEHVAVKVLHEGFADQVDRIKHEVRVARRVTDKGVVRFHDFGVDGEVVYITMELAHAGTLADRLDRLERAERLDIARELARGLAAIHEVGVVHRDIKPQNVLFDELGHAKVGDFGISQLGVIDEDGVQGTPFYMSPEQIRGDLQTPASDVYSMGVLLYELFAGELPFSGSPGKVLTGHLAQAPNLDGLDPEIAEVVRRSLDKDSAGRYASGAELLRALEEIR